MSTSDYKSVRVPVIPLDYNSRFLAEKKELLFDYNTGQLYVVSAEDKNVIFNITDVVLEKVQEGIDLDNLIINVEGIGDVNLSEYIEYLNKYNLTLSDNDSKQYYAPTVKFDNMSIILRDGVATIAGFEHADNDTYAIKHDNQIKWVPRQTFLDLISQKAYEDIRQMLNDYATKTGTGASGTWGINITGNANTATKLQTPRTISLAGGASGSATFDGSGDISINTTINTATKATQDGNGANIAGTYLKKSGDTVTGTLNVPTQIVTDNSTKVANTAFVQSAVDSKVSQLVNSAPEALDTLNELSNALGNDPNFATTVTNMIGLKEDKTEVNNKIALHNADVTAHKPITDLISQKEDKTVVNSKLSTHNTDTSAHEDIRQKFNDYATKTGTGASGTWGINITGNANTATKATQDSNGANIAGTYLKKSGDTVTGTLNVPTQAITDNSTKVANTAFVQSAVSKLVNSAPEALDTLNELSNALGNDPNFATTVTNMIGLKADKTEVNNKIALHNTDETAHKPITDLISQKADKTEVDNKIALHNTDGTAHQPILDLIGLKADKTEVNSKLSTHNTDTSAHEDIRQMIKDYVTNTGEGASGTWGTGNANTATKLQTPRTISLAGGASGSATFDGSGDISINTTINTATKATNDGNGNVIANTYLKKAGDTVTGTLNVPTQAITDNSTKVANTAFVQSAVDSKVSKLVNSAPEALDTLNELSNALGNDPNFATTVTNMIGLKEDKTVVDNKIALHNTDETAHEDIRQKFNDYATKTGTGASGTWGINITGNANTATKATQDGNGANIAGTYLKKSGDTATGSIVAPSFQTGEADANYFQCQKFRGEGNADIYYHAIDFGYAGHDQVDFHEYGGTWNFYTNLAGTKEGGVLIGSINPTGWNGNVVGNVKGNANTATKATQDGVGNVIADTYLKKTGDTVTGTLNVPTQAITDNSTKVANTAFVQSAVDSKVSKLVNSAPETLDTLNELSNALGNDPNFATTVSNMIGQKEDKTAVDNKIALHNTDATAHQPILDLINSNQAELNTNLSTHNTDLSAHADIRQMFNNYLSIQESEIKLTTHNTATDSHEDIRLMIGQKADNDTLTSYVPLAGATMTGELTVPALKATNGFISNTDTTSVNTASGGSALVMKKTSSTDAPSNGVVLEYGNSTSWAGQLYMADNAEEGLYWNGWNDGVRGSWKKIYMEGNTNDIKFANGIVLTIE